MFFKKTLHNWRVRWHALSKPIHFAYLVKTIQQKPKAPWVSSHRGQCTEQFQGADFHIIFYVNGAPTLCCTTPEQQYIAVLLIMFIHSMCWMWGTRCLKLENLVSSYSSLIQPKRPIYWFEKKLFIYNN